MRTKKLATFLAAVLFFVVASFNAVQANPVALRGDNKEDRIARESRVTEPVNLAILVQDDLVSRVGNELKVTGEFIRALPAGSRVMVGYLRVGVMQVRQPFTTDLERAARSLRIPVGSTSAAPFNPYVEVVDALRLFDTGGPNRNALLLISDGLDVSRGFDFSSTVHSIDLDRAIREARKQGVKVYTFYAPTVGLTSQNRLAVSFGQSALNRLADETGGEAFFQGTSFVTFDSYFKRLGRSINKQSAAAE